LHNKIDQIGESLNLANLLMVNYAMDEKFRVFSHQIYLVDKFVSHFGSVNVLTGQEGVCRVLDGV
jgi:hypothetical protein